MTIVASGEISLGGNATATRSVACELSLSGTATISLNDAAVRGLAQKTTAGEAICMSNFYSKTDTATTIGQLFKGGYYVGTISSPANYYLVVAPATCGGAMNCQWKTNTDGDGMHSGNATCNENNGYYNTYVFLNSSTYPAGNYARTRTIGGFTDWYMPAINELNILWNQRHNFSDGTSTGSSWHSSSSEGVFDARSCNICWSVGYISNIFKCDFCPSRVVRRIPF